MRVLQVHTRYRQAGGEDSVVDAEGRLLEEAGHDVWQYFLENPVSSVEAGFALLRAPWNRSAAQRVVDRARELEVDVIHVHNTWFALSPAVFRAVREAGFPVVATMHNYRLSCVNAMHYRNGSACDVCVGRVPWRGVVHRCYRSSAAQSGVVAVTIATHRLAGTWEGHVDAVIALTGFAADRLAASGVPADHIVVKPNVVDDPGSRAEPPSSSSRILFVGRFTEEKGVTDLLDAWAGVRADLELEMIGDGPLLASSRSAAVSGVSISGPHSRERVRERMLNSRALVLPSRWFEGLPMVLVEALSCGLPVIVPSHGALPGVSGDAGLTFIPGDVHDLRRAIEETRDDAKIDALASEARDSYEHRFSPAIGLAQLTEVYERVIKNSNAGNAR